MSDSTHEPSLQPFQHRDHVPVCLFPCTSINSSICLESPPHSFPPFGPLEVTYLSFILVGSFKSSLPYWRLLVFQWTEWLKFSMDVPFFNHLKCKKKKKQNKFNAWLFRLLTDFILSPPLSCKLNERRSYYVVFTFFFPKSSTISELHYIFMKEWMNEFEGDTMANINTIVCSKKGNHTKHGL